MNNSAEPDIRKTPGARLRLFGGLMLIVFGCIIYAIVQQMWPSMWILIAMEVILIIVTAGAGILDVLLEEASINLGLLIRS